MTAGTKVYLGAVIGLGGGVLAIGLPTSYQATPSQLAWFVLAALIASALKMRLPGTDATFSLSAAVLLFGVFRFTLAECLLAACCGALVQSYWSSSQRDPLKLSFNIANHTLVVAVSWNLVHLLRVRGTHETAVFVVVACAYFALNTFLTAVIVSLSSHRPIARACNQWYEWSAPCFLCCAVIAGTLAGPEQGRTAAWLLLLPLLYLIHFFMSLSRQSLNAVISLVTPETFPKRALAYIWMVVAAGLALLCAGLAFGRTINPLALAGFTILTVLASMLKIRLPRITGTLSLNFVMLMVALSEAGVWDAILLAGIAGVVQSLWRPKRKPLAIQVAFNAACLMVATAAAGVGFLFLGSHTPDSSLLFALVPASVVLYLTNTVMVAFVLCLIRNRPLVETWDSCHFWSLPYYAVGTAAAALMIYTSQSSGWYSSLLIFPVMAILYNSYRQHVAHVT